MRRAQIAPRCGVMFIGVPDRLPLNDAELVAIETYWADILDEVLRSLGLVCVRAWSRHIGSRV